MRRVVGPFMSILLFVLSWMTPIPASALDVMAERGEHIFTSNCAACHMGGGNVLRASRSLKMRDLNAHLEAYKQDPLEALEHQIEDGMNAMPAYAGKLSESEIIAVATYVEQQAELGW